MRSDRPGETRAAFDAPLSSGIDIRACFGEADVKQRREACSDQYAFRGLLSAAPAAASGAMRLAYKSRATTYPGKVSRGEDSTLTPPLKQSDLRTVLNGECSVSRTLTRNAATGAFVWDAPLPECSDFLEP